jgi:hypothetical protein
MGLLNETEKVTLPVKLTNVVWPGLDNVSDFISQDPEGNLVLKSVDENNVARIVLSKNKFQFSVTFLYLLPFKKPQWQKEDSSNDSTLKSIILN